MYKIPSNAKYYPKAGIILKDWEVEFFQYISKGYTVREISEMTGKTRRQYDWVLNKVMDDTNVKNKIHLIAYLIRNKVIK